MKSTSQRIFSAVGRKTSPFLFYLLFLPVICFVVACTVPESSLADKKNYTKEDDEYKKKYQVAFEEGEKPMRYWYHYIVSSFPGGYRVRIFHPDKKTLIEEKNYSTSALTLLHGPYKSYWDDGSIRAFGNYQFGRRHGSWLDSEPGNGKSSSGDYRNDKKDGTWTQLDTNGIIESVYGWLDGKRHGKFFEFDSMGVKINEGIYKQDTLISELFKKPVVERPYLKNCATVYEMDVYTCTDKSILQQVYSSLHYPPTAKQMGIEGQVLIQWDVMTNGDVKNIRVPQALSDEIEAECLQAISRMPAWSPALRAGVPVKYTMSLPLQFSL